ncbi:PEP-CTERM sorting domain-containing protein [Elioraea rosea]|uniref:PEP-CTERM sorting domain-containing protein n=1 Tax=Elioraea rosea TaxID=2492390 RepID=UPI001185A45F|nr:PEP-CTERM sorting domain-containing protein [Elioraea rosea]
MTSFVSRATLIAAVAASVFAFAPTGTASASVAAVADPGGTTSEIGARIRWGATGFEASVYDANGLNQNPTLNPGGSPVWQLNQAYGFEVRFTQATGELQLSVDFNRGGSFGAGEVISRSSFAAPGLVSYAGIDFSYLSISGNEGGSTARSTLSNLLINGTSLPSITPNGALVDQFYSGVAGDIVITGDITFLNSGTSQERPAYDFRFRSGGPTPVPEPATLALLGMGLLGLGAARLRRRR